MATFTVGTHNVLFRLDRERWLEDLDRSHEVADVRLFQEGGSKKFRRTLRKHKNMRGLRKYHPHATECPIAWRRDVWKPMWKESGAKGASLVHPGAGFAKFNPKRSIVWKGLTHRKTGKRVLFVNVHATAGYAKDERKTPWGDRLDDWKNWAARQMWLAVVAFLAEQMKREVWDVIVLGGDFNARLNNRGEWYYPGPMLDGLTIEDEETPRSIDRLVLTRDSRAKTKRRWGSRRGYHTDHAVHFARVRLDD